MDFTQHYEVTDVAHFKGREIEVVHYQPDHMALVDGTFIGFYRTSGAALNGAQRYVNEIEKEASKA